MNTHARKHTCWERWICPLWDVSEVVQRKSTVQDKFPERSYFWTPSKPLLVLLRNEGPFYGPDPLYRARTGHWSHFSKPPRQMPHEPYGDVCNPGGWGWGGGLVPQRLLEGWGALRPVSSHDRDGDHALPRDQQVSWRPWWVSWSPDSRLSNWSSFSPQVWVFQTEVVQVPGATERQRTRVAKNQTKRLLRRKQMLKVPWSDTVLRTMRWKKPQLLFGVFLSFDLAKWCAANNLFLLLDFPRAIMVNESMCHFSLFQFLPHCNQRA